MHAVDWLGIAGSLLVFASFWMKSTIPLRTLALASNVLFIAYGYVAWLIPILVLHCALLPLNLMRLRQLHRRMKANDKRQREARAILRTTRGKAKMHRTEGSASEAF